LTLSLAMISAPKIKAGPPAGVIVATCIAAAQALLQPKFTITPEQASKENPNPRTPKQCKTVEIILNGIIELTVLSSILFLAYKASKNV